MIRFLFKGILNDKSRSLLPVIIVALGVATTVLLYCWLTGIMGESITMNANFNTGHIKITTKAYANDEGSLPNDLAILEADSLISNLRHQFPALEWHARLRFGALADFPDANGETKAQGPVVGWAIDLLSPNSLESERLQIAEAITVGTLPVKHNQALVAHDFAQKLNVKVGDILTLVGTDMNGSMAMKNFEVSGTLRFGTTMLDRGALFIDIDDARQWLGIPHGAGEIVGFFINNRYNDTEAIKMQTDFNSIQNANDPYAPILRRMRDQGSMAEYMDYAGKFGSIMVIVFVMAMSIVLWNTGILGGLRRYNEFGIRLAMGEHKSHIYATLIAEGAMIGTIGSVFGTAIGLAVAYYLQTVGVNISSSMQNSSIMMPSVVRAVITPTAFYIGFWPGLVSMVLGNALSGLGIYRRQTARLFSELE